MVVFGDLGVRAQDIGALRGEFLGNLGQDSTPVRAGGLNPDRMPDVVALLPFGFDETLGVGVENLFTIRLVDRDAPSARDEPHDLVAGQGVAAFGELDHDVVDPFDENGALVFPFDFGDEFLKGFFLFTL